MAKFYQTFKEEELITILKPFQKEKKKKTKEDITLPNSFMRSTLPWYQSHIKDTIREKKRAGKYPHEFGCKKLNKILLLLLLSRSVVSDSVRSHRRQSTRLRRPWDSPGKTTGVGCHFLLQCMKVKSESEVTQSCSTLSNPMDCSPPRSSVHGIFQVRGLEWGAIAFSTTKY